MLLPQLECRDRRRERQRDGVPWRSAEHCSDFATPPRELEPRDARIGDFVDDVVDFAAECIQRDDRAPSLRRKKAEAVVEARAAARGFFFAVGIRSHRVSADAVIAAQSRPESCGRWRKMSPCAASIAARILKPPASTNL